MTWNDVTIGVFQELKEFEKNTEGMDLIDITLGRLSILFQKDEDYWLNQVPHIEFVRDARLINFLAEAPIPELKEEITLVQRKKVDGKMVDIPIICDFQPNVSRFTTSQYIDVTESLKQEQPLFSVLMAAVYIPRNEKGEARKYQEGYDARDIAELMNKQVPITYAIGVSTFYYELFNALSQSTLSFLRKKLRKAQKKETNLKKKVIIQESIEAIQNSRNVILGSYLRRKYGY